jgi:type IV secretory pathway ATPase VirB11/archaellum biosynthesis ATPase
MLYLGKRITELAERVRLPRKRIFEESDPSEIGFSIEGSGPGVPAEQRNGLVPRAILKQGTSYAYAVANCIGEMTTSERKLAEKAKGAMIDVLAKAGDEINMTLFPKAREMARAELARTMSNERADYVSYILAHDTVGYGPISILMEDRERIEEIEINSPSAPISVFHVSYGRCRTNLRFANEMHFRHALNKLIYETDKELGDNSPIIDAQVDGARIHAQMKPYAASGAVASIRLSGSKIVGADYLAKRGTTNFEVLAYLWMAMDAGCNIVIAGSPASGKTTLLSALFFFVPISERIVTIEEDINELKAKIDINNSVALYGSRYGNSVSTREQVINALRMRPDRLVVGEVRGEETRELFSGANLGVPFITTMHSGSGGTDIIKKLLVRPMSVEPKSLSRLDVAVYMRHLDLSKRLLSDIYEYRWLSRAETDKLGIEIEDSDSVDIGNIVTEGSLDMRTLQNSKVICAFSRKKGVTAKAALRELVRRAEFLRVLCESGIGTEEIQEKVQGYGL